MSKHWQYLKYVLRHKWYVGLECFRLGLYWRGIVHDLSKFRPSEWFPYANYFYGKGAAIRRDKTGYYKPTDTGDAAFDFAWLLHQKRNHHHWQWWCLPEDEGGLKVLQMDDKSTIEMFCDWCGAAQAQGKERDSVVDWWLANKCKMKIHDKTIGNLMILLAEPAVRRGLFDELRGIKR